jgi:hypothetical protein
MLIASGESRSAHRRCASNDSWRSTIDARAAAAVRALSERKLAPVFRAKSSGTQLPINRHGLPGRATTGSVPIGKLCASRHSAWWYRSRRRNTVIASVTAPSDASQQCAASSASRDSSDATPGSYAR